MVKNLNTIIISLICSLGCVSIYHYYNKVEIEALDQNYARLVAQYDQSPKTYVLQPNKTSIIADIDFVPGANKAKDAVVSIEAVSIKKERFKNDKYSKSNGSGVIISSNGYIITNEHVISDASEINLKLEDQREYKAEVIGSDKSTDLAILKINAQQLPYLQFADSDNIEVGEWVLAVGNPFKLSSSVTAGIVSAKARNINIFRKQGIESFIQTDAAINPGNSGGALINIQGDLVGINTAILTYSGKYEGFSFAIPSNLAKKVMTDLREYGAVQRAWLGITPLKVDNKRAKALKLNKIGGVFVDLVEKDGAAAQAGLRYEDVITSIDGTETMSLPRFLAVLGQYRPGDTIEIEYFRNGRLAKTSATLHNQLNTTDFVAVRKDKIFTDLGFEVRDLDAQEKDTNNKTGVMVVSILKNSKIESVNMDPGYIITSMNGEKIASVDQLKTLLESKEGEIYLNGFYENYPMEWPYKFEK